MAELQLFLKQFLYFSEGMAAVVAVLKYKKFKDSYWKWFIYYLIFIFIAETVSKFILCYFTSYRSYFYDFVVIPIEFIFLYWLCSFRSLANKKLFWVSCGIFMFSLLPYFVFEGSSVVNSFNYIVGTFLLSIMIILEYNKQMKTDDILRFRENIMFYINTGACLFYVGTLPLFSFNGLIWKDKDIFYNYYLLFLIAGILMYILFSIALLWGKPNTY